jgi:filamentous hemagglutinin
VVGVSVEQLEARLVMASAVWDGGPAGTGTSWQDPANWAGDVLPANGDDVTISVAADPLILYSSGTLTLNSLTTDEDLRLTGGELGVSGAADINAVLSLSGGAMSGGSWDVTGGLLQPLSTNSNAIRNAAIVGDITLDQANGRVQISGTTTWSGAARLGASTTTLGVSGGSSLPGDVVFEGAGTGVRAITMVTAGALTIPAGVEISTAPGFAGGGQLGGSQHWASAMNLVNEGTIVFQSTASRSLDFRATTVVNNATIECTTSDLAFVTGFVNAGAITSTGGGAQFAGAWDNSAGTVSLVDGDLTLGGTFTTGAVGVITRSGTTTVSLTGALDNTGDTLAFNAATGSWTMAAGSITGGQVTSAGGARLDIGTNNSNRLSDVQVVGDLVLAISSGRVHIAGSTTWTGTARLAASTTTLGFDGGASLPGDVVFEGAATGVRAITMVTAGTLTIPAGVEISTAPGFAGGGQLGGSQHWASAMNLVNEGAIGFESTVSRALDFRATTVVNNSTIGCTTSELSFVTGFTNTGTITSTSGRAVFGGAWDNSAGTVNLIDGDLTLGGSFTTAGVGTITRSGTTTVSLTGALDNTGDTLAFSAATGSWAMEGGNITGGQMTSAGGARLDIGTNNGNRLSDVQVVGDLVLAMSSGRVHIAGSTTWTGTARLAASTTTLGFNGGASLPGDVVFEGAATGVRAITMVTAGTLTIPGGVAVYTEPGFLGSGQLGGSQHWASAMNLVNEGAIGFEGSVSRSLDFRATTVVNHSTIACTTSELSFVTGFVNTGAITSTSGKAVFGGAWDNSAGTVNILDGDLTLAGTFTTAGVGTINRSGTTTVSLTGALDNTGDTLAFSAATGSWAMEGGTITGGQMTSADGARLDIGTTNNNRLTDVVVVGDLVLAISSGRVHIAGSTTWTGAARLAASTTTLGFSGGASVPADIAFEGAGTGIRAITMVTAGTLTIPAGVAVYSEPGFAGAGQIGGSHHWAGAMDLVNEGSIGFESAPSRVMSLLPATLANAGTIVAAGGTVRVRPQSSLDNTGTLRAEVGGTLEVDLGGPVFVNDGTLASGPGGTVHVLGDLTLGAASTVRIEINGFTAADIGFLDVDGLMTRGGTMQVAGVDGWTPECVLLDCVSAGSSAGVFATLDLPTAPAGHNSFLIFVPDGRTIRFAISPESDWNADGQLDTLDFLSFLNSWASGESRADFNHDGRIDTLDFLSFLNSWANGCDG